MPGAARLLPRGFATPRFDAAAQTVKNQPAIPVSNVDSSTAIGQSHRRGALGVVRTAGGALLNWWRAATLEGLCVGALWWLGLTLLHVPLAPLWAILAALAAFIPHFGGVLSVIGPVLTVAVSGHDYSRLGLVLGLYATVVVLDQLVIQPLLLKRTTRVPIWLSILAPIALGIVIPFWGVLLAPPLLAVVFAFRRTTNDNLPLN